MHSAGATRITREVVQNDARARRRGGAGMSARGNPETMKAGGANADFRGPFALTAAAKQLPEVLKMPIKALSDTL